MHGLIVARDVAIGCTGRASDVPDCKVACATFNNESGEDSSEAEGRGEEGENKNKTKKKNRRRRMDSGRITGGSEAERVCGRED